MIVAQWPVSSFYVLGIFLGIDLIFIGSGWIAIGLALRRHARLEATALVPAPVAPRRRAGVAFTDQDAP